MAGINNVPAFLEDYICYVSGNKLPGTVDVTMPKITPKIVTVNGAGVAGDMDMPTRGQTDNMETEINFRTTIPEQINLAQPKAIDVEFRGAQWRYDAALGEYKKEPVVVMMRILPKEIDLGKLSSAETTEAKLSANVQYLKVTINDKKEVEIDKFNYIHYIHGTDYLADVRDMLGM